MRIDILTIFPEFFDTPLKCGPIRIALEKKVLEVSVHNLRDYTKNKHRKVDDYPYGGGAGMIMKIEPIYNAISALRKKNSYIILFSPKGRLYNQLVVHEFLEKPHLIFICGRYKSVDARVYNFIDDEISIGDYILSGGEIPALVLVDTIARLLPGVLGDIESAETDSFESRVIDAPYYTVPREFMGYKVPEVLLSGNHKLIDEWRHNESERLTQEFIERRKHEYSRIFKELYRAG